MTGFGSATGQGEGIRVAVEAKSVNSRFLKLMIKAPPSLGSHETALEALAKSKLRRGSVTLSVNVQPTDPAALVAVNEEVVRAYQEVFQRLGLPEDRIPTLPGVIGSTHAEPLAETQWTVVRETAEAALDRLVEMRGLEGEELRKALLALCDRVAALSNDVALRSPEVVKEYQTRLHERITALLQDGDRVEPDNLAREVALFASRCDITEEIDRLGVHLGQMRQLLVDGTEVGRRLEFVAQELHREVNTIASKSADADVARLAVALKSELEKIKEQVANIE